ncbi:unnamed protein product, partial [Polarella glacialis]
MTARGPATTAKDSPRQTRPWKPTAVTHSVMYLNGTRLELSLKPPASIQKLKEQVHAKTGVAPRYQLLNLGEVLVQSEERDSQGRRLKELGMSDYDLKPSSQLHLADLGELLPARGKAAQSSFEKAAHPGCEVPCKIDREELRGVTVGQLQHLLGFVERHCGKWTDADTQDSFNSRSMSITQVAKRVVKSGFNSRSMSVAQVAEWVVKPATFDLRCSYVEFVATSPSVQWPKWFASHWWGQPLRGLSHCIEAHQKVRRPEPHSASASTAYWLCACARNLHQGWGQDAGASLGAVQRALRGCEGLLLALDGGGMALTRTWCLFEVATALDRARDTERSGSMLLDLAMQPLNSSQLAKSGHCSLDALPEDEAMPASPKLKWKALGTHVGLVDRGSDSDRRKPLCDSDRRGSEEMERMAAAMAGAIASSSVRKINRATVLTEGLSQSEQETDANRFPGSGWALKSKREETFPVAELSRRFLDIHLGASQAAHEGDRQRLLHFLSRRTAEEDVLLRPPPSEEACNRVSARIRSALAVTCWPAAAFRCAKKATKMPDSIVEALHGDASRRVLRIGLAASGPGKDRLSELARGISPGLREFELLLCSSSDAGESQGFVGLQALANALPEGLQRLKLDLRVSDLGDQVLTVMAWALGQRLRSLRSLDLRLSESSSDDAGLRELAVALPPELTSLELHVAKDRPENHCFYISDIGLNALTQALPKGLTTLNLNFCNTNVTDAGVQELALALPMSLSGLSLELRGCRVSEEVRHTACSLYSMKKFAKDLMQDLAHATSGVRLLTHSLMQGLDMEQAMETVSAALVVTDGAQEGDFQKTMASRLADSCRELAERRRKEAETTSSDEESESDDEDEDGDGGQERHSKIKLVTIEGHLPLSPQPTTAFPQGPASGGGWSENAVGVEIEVISAVGSASRLSGELVARSAAERFLAGIVQACIARAPPPSLPLAGSPSLDSVSSNAKYSDDFQDEDGTETSESSEEKAQSQVEAEESQSQAAKAEENNNSSSSSNNDKKQEAQDEKEQQLNADEMHRWSIEAAAPTSAHETLSPSRLPRPPPRDQRPPWRPNSARPGRPRSAPTAHGGTVPTPRVLHPVQRATQERAYPPTTPRAVSACRPLSAPAGGIGGLVEPQRQPLANIKFLGLPRGSGSAEMAAMRPMSARTQRALAVNRLAFVGGALEDWRPPSVPADADVRRSLCALRQRREISEPRALEPTDMPLNFEVKLLGRRPLSARTPRKEEAGSAEVCVADGRGMGGLAEQLRELCITMVDAPDHEEPEVEEVPEPEGDPVWQAQLAFWALHRRGSRGVLGWHDKDPASISRRQQLAEAVLVTELRPMANELQMPMQELLLAKSIFESFDADGTGVLEEEALVSAVTDLEKATSTVSSTMTTYFKVFIQTRRIKKQFQVGKTSSSFGKRRSSVVRLEQGLSWTWKDFVRWYWSGVTKGIFMTENQLLVDMAAKHKVRPETLIGLKNCFDECSE